MKPDMNIYQKKASILTDALPYLRDFNQKIIVISYLCSDLLSSAEEQEIMRDITTLQSVGMKVVIVHNTRMGADKFRENKRLAKLVEFCGVKAIGICGVDEQTLHMTIDNNYIPVVSPNDIDTEFLNLSPIDTARAIATLLGAEKLIYLGKYDYLTDEDDQHIFSMRAKEMPPYIEDCTDPVLKQILENCKLALDNKVARAHIIDAKIKHALLLELFSIRGIGTVFLSDDAPKYSHELQNASSK